jgi:hypothetical protein
MTGFAHLSSGVTSIGTVRRTQVPLITPESTFIFSIINEVESNFCDSLEATSSLRNPNVLQTRMANISLIF